MTWTFSGAPSTSTAAGRRDAVRLLVGDTDTTDQQVTDETITFALSEASDAIYSAAAYIARTLEGKYARLVDTRVEGISVSYSQRRDSYKKLSARLEKQAKTAGGGLGVPVAGGISISDMDSVEEDSDRVDPAFQRNQFRNPSDVDLDELVND